MDDALVAELLTNKSLETRQDFTLAHIYRMIYEKGGTVVSKLNASTLNRCERPCH